MFNINIKSLLKYRYSSIYKRLRSYILIGSSGFIVQLILNSIFINVYSINFKTSLLISIICGASSNYFFFNLITFKDKILTGFKFLIGLLKFYFISSLSLIINYFVSLLLFNIFNFNYFFSQLGGLTLAFVFNYLVLTKIIWGSR